jgi:hypothetical protein
VVFADGLPGFHGTLQPVANQQELECEIVQAYKKEVLQADSEQKHEITLSRKFTSTDYRHVKTNNPVDILGIAMRPDTVQPTFQQLSDSTLGLDRVDEEFLQYVMEGYPQGKVWYLDDDQYCCEGGTISSDGSDDIQRLTHAFRGAWGTTLHETLSSVLSYTRINQFEWGGTVLDKSCLACLHGR